MPRILILGTGTDVGKTCVAEALIHALRRRLGNAPVIGVKPVESGVTEASATDAARLALASSVAPGPPPYAFEPALSPHLAAERTSSKIDLLEIRTYLAALPYATLHDTWIVCETAGGALSPLSSELVNLDLVGALHADRWVLIAPDRLGVLHELRATLLACTALGAPPPIVVLRRPGSPDASTGTNATELRKLGWAEPLAAETDAALAEALATRLTAARL